MKHPELVSILGSAAAGAIAATLICLGFWSDAQETSRAPATVIHTPGRMDRMRLSALSTKFEMLERENHALTLRVQELEGLSASAAPLMASAAPEERLDPEPLRAPLTSEREPVEEPPPSEPSTASVQAPTLAPADDIHAETAALTEALRDPALEPAAEVKPPAAVESTAREAIASAPPAAESRALDLKMRGIKKRLGLDDGAVLAVQRVLTREVRQRTALLREVRKSGDWKTARERMQTIRLETLSSLAEVLSPKQLDTYKALQD